jgi:hypothetical protein
MKPRHDQGRFHIPFNVAEVGDPEPIERILDQDLGRSPVITPVGRTAYPYCGTPMVSFVNMVASGREDVVCEPCYEQAKKQGHPPCSCTLRKRFLDRWVCVTCYKKEEQMDIAKRMSTMVINPSTMDHYHVCSCGADFADDWEPKTLCNWCHGEIIGDGDEEVTEDGTHTEDDEEHEDEEHSAADYADLEPGEFGYAKNRDGTFSVYIDGHCIRGERLSRTLVRQAMAYFGMPAVCTCCKCNGRQPHGEHESDGEDVEGLAEDMPDPTQTDGAVDAEPQVEFDEESESEIDWDEDLEPVIAFDEEEEPLVDFDEEEEPFLLDADDEDDML